MNKATTNFRQDTPVLVLCSPGADLELVRVVLRDARIAGTELGEEADLAAPLRAGVAAAVVSEERLTPAVLACLAESRATWESTHAQRNPARHPAGDLPVIILVTRGADSPQARASVHALPRLILLEEPVAPAVLLSALRSALWQPDHAAPSLDAAGPATPTLDTRFSQMADAAPVMIWRAGLDKGCDYFNKPWLEFTGRTLEQEFGAGWAQGVHPEDLQRCVQTYEGCFDRHEPFKMEYRLRRHDGEFRWILDQGVPCTTTRGGFAGFIGSSIDITEHKRLLERLESERGRLRTMNETLEERVKERTAVAVNQAEQLRALAGALSRAEQQERHRIAQVLHDQSQQLLVAAKMRVGTLRRRLDNPDLSAATGEVDELLGQLNDSLKGLIVQLSPPVLQDAGLGAALVWLGRWMQKHHGLAVAVEVERAADPQDEGVRGLLFHAVRGLLLCFAGNGAQAACIALRLGPEGVAQVIVERTGQVSAQELQTPGKMDPELRQIKQRVELLGGQLTLEALPAMGARALIRAPLHVDPTKQPTEMESIPGRDAHADRTPSPQPRRHKRPAGDAKIRVLLADDHKILREGLAGLLREQEDIEVIGQASDGQMAVDLCDRLHPDVVVMDVSMPKLNGIEATRRIHAQAPQVRVVGLSMHEEEDMAAAMRDAGASAYLTKGGPVEALIAAIRNSDK